MLEEKNPMGPQMPMTFLNDSKIDSKASSQKCYKQQYQSGVD